MSAEPGVADRADDAAPVHVVGLGADGWAGLTDDARAVLRRAGVVIGGPRQLDLLGEEVTAERVAWPTPLRPAVRGLVDRYGRSSLVVLASGDPVHYGIGTTLAAEVGAGRLVLHSHPSSMSLACARLGWPVEDVTVVSGVGRRLDALAAALHDGERVLLLSRDASTPRAAAALLRDRGFGGSRVTVLSQLGGPGERRVERIATDWADGTGPDEQVVDALNVVAITCVRDDDTPALGLVPGLPDDAYETDGQLTKWEVRALTLAALAPAPGELLWDVGGGTGTIGIEWMRAHRRCRAVALEPRADRAERIARNAARLGVPGLRVVTGRAPDALAGLDPPDAIFVGGGLTEPGLLEHCLAALRPGGRIVVNAVTLESEALLVDAARRLGGRLTRLEVSRAEGLGSFTGWVPARPVTQWAHRLAPVPGRGPAADPGARPAREDGASRPPRSDTRHPSTPSIAAKDPS
ncbi:precorrin-6y C5,15-methyltransferase (decarboxylating) subunit CbiE [Agilicoccus flavus]|uniref:precorrin-6y C5,15-methyltransferase (decarboxylating) subunit CbiE n=1 Tax=Agilicoccus flavus TaxID=2775968 RepID=UPI001CF71926|nr:precorrin-6y C5,15-methyltransferase (decarboxylating) subunit CbiE [Agilicoccus flavus]